MYPVSPLTGSSGVDICARGGRTAQGSGSPRVRRKKYVVPPGPMTLKLDRVCIRIRPTPRTPLAEATLQDRCKHHRKGKLAGLGG
jgi:hypothetical protein